jgi:REP element-mobilizing transposase RayT
MNRGRRQEKIFLDKEDYLLFLEILKEASRMWNFEVSAYCLMGNHYHLLVRTPDANISRCMRHINGVYTQRFNRKYSFDGQLFRGRYKAVLVEEDAHLLELLRYIHRNPIKANLVKEIESYPWCSHKAYLQGSRGWDWLQRETLLGLFSKKKKQAFASYIDFMNQEDSDRVVNFFSKKNLSSIFGTADFIEKIKTRFGHLAEDREVSETEILKVNFETVSQAVCEAWPVSADLLFKCRRGERNMARDLTIYLMRQYSAETLQQIGRHLEINSYSTVSSAIQRIKKDLKTDKKLAATVVKIEKVISKGQA